MNIIQKQSPNFAVGRSGQKIEAIVIHIMAGTLIGTDSWFATPMSQVSAHYGVGFTGEIHQYVQDANTAWHVGKIVQPTSWSLLKSGVNPNLYTLGIENEGQNLRTAPITQLNTLVSLIRSLATTYNIPLDRDHIIGHYQIKASKVCPSADHSIIDTIVAMCQADEQVPLTVPKSRLLKIQDYLSKL